MLKSTLLLHIDNFLALCTPTLPWIFRLMLYLCSQYSRVHFNIIRNYVKCLRKQWLNPLNAGWELTPGACGLSDVPKICVHLYLTLFDHTLYLLWCPRPAWQLWEVDRLHLKPEQADSSGIQQQAFPVFLPAGHGQHVCLRPRCGRQDQVWQGETVSIKFQLSLIYTACIPSFNKCIFSSSLQMQYANRVVRVCEFLMMYILSVDIWAGPQWTGAPVSGRARLHQQVL